MNSWLAMEKPGLKPVIEIDFKDKFLVFSISLDRRTI